MRIFSKHRNVMLIFLAAFLVAVAVAALRFFVYGIPDIVGFPTYFHQRIAGDIISGSFNWYDSLSFGGRAYTYPPFFVFSLASFGLLLGLKAGGVIMLALCGSLCAVLFYLIARKLDKEKANIAVFMLLLSPGFIYLFSHLSTRSPPILFGMLSLYLLMSKHPLLSGISLGAAFLFHPETGIVFFIILILFSLFGSNKKFSIKQETGLLKALLLCSIIAALFYVPFVMSHGLPEINGLHEEYRTREYSLESSGMENYVFELGQDGKLALLVFIFSFVGLCAAKNNFARSWFVLCLLLTLAAERFVIYLIFPAIILASEGICYLLSKASKRRRKIMLAVVAVYVILIGALYANYFAQSYPTKEQLEALNWIKENTPANVTVLSDWSFGHWISGIAQRKNFMDGYAEYAPDANIRLAALHEFFGTCKAPAGVSYAYMEKWFADKYAPCMYNLTSVYSKDNIFVFRVG